MNNGRRGSILIVAVGLAALMLTMFVVINRQLRTDVNDGIIVMHDAQARMMLPAALGFILECGRLGNHQDGEVFGWTDVRDGKAGPRGPRPAGGALPAEVGGGAWPAPGSTYRADMYVRQQPRFAVRYTRVYNPVIAPPAWIEEYENGDDRSGTFLNKALRPTAGAGTEVGQVPGNTSKQARSWWWTEEDTPVLTNKGAKEHWGRVWNLIFEPMDRFDSQFHHGLNPQPLADSWTEFETGDQTPLLPSTNLAWFRVYRERSSDHDGDGSPWWDNMALSGHGVFIVTCGAGGTRGYRDWGEVTADGAEAVFMNDQSFFEDLRAQERILWYRVEWTGFTGGNYDTMRTYDVSVVTHGKLHDRPMPKAFTNLHTQIFDGDSDDAANSKIPILNALGCFKWIERLDREPTDAAGNPIW